MEQDLKNNFDINKRCLTKEIFEEKLLKKDSYYKGRWPYFEEVIVQLKKMGNIGNVLELGPYKSPIIMGEDVLDKYDNVSEFPYEIGKFYKHDGSIVPYPIKDKQYDLVIGLQVLEHFGIFGQQKAVIDEIERISNRLLITLPYKWHKPNLRDHHMIDKETIAEWFDHREPIFEQIIDNRILQIYEFDLVENIYELPLKSPNNNALIIDNNDYERTFSIIPRNTGSCYSYAKHHINIGKKYRFIGKIYNNNINDLVIRMSANSEEKILSESIKRIECVDKIQHIKLELIPPKNANIIYIQIFKYGALVEKQIKISNFKLFEYK